MKPIYLLGLSGGADSVYLFHYFLRKGIPFHAAHFNHGWRDDAAEDSAFCEALCAQHNIPFYLGHAADSKNLLPAHHQKNRSAEARARYQRRAFLEKTMRDNNLTGIALAHHRDDQVATLLIRLIRGSTLAGLGGMQERSGDYYRPLLNLSKDKMVSYLQEQQITYCTDSSNNDMGYLRNRLNTHLLPALRQCDQRALPNIARSMEALHEENAFLESLVRDLHTKIADENGALHLPTLRQQHPVLQRRLLLQLLITHNIPFTPSEGLLAEILRFVQHQRGGSHRIGEKVSLVKKGSTLSIKTSF